MSNPKRIFVVSSIVIGLVAASLGIASAALTLTTAGPTAVTLAQLDGGTEPLSFDLKPPYTPYKLVVDGVFVGKDLTKDPVRIEVSTIGRHKLRFDGSGGRAEATWTAEAGVPTPTPSVTPTVAPSPSQTPSPTPSGPSGAVHVSSAAGLAQALADATPGTVIDLTDGTYQNAKGKRFEASASGTPASPITLRGSRAAVLESDGPSGDYGLHVTGSYWRISGLTVAQASKGIVLDGSVGTVLDGVQVKNIGDEGVHFRACSANGVLENSYVHDTGQVAPQYGEGVYVGSANSNWSKYACTDGRDNSEHVTVRANTFQNIPAEGADLKEGTDSGTLSGNTFDRTGYSGQNSADSAVDVKGNGWVIEGNTIENPQGADLDGIQVHSVYSGYGTGNTISGNKVEGAWPGFGIGLYTSGNSVGCDNTAPGAAQGVVGLNHKPVTCK